ncbi:MAG: hypothetical protein JXA78_10645 [Anaerolineales bacterium]|nr:hypothetical protein [Anaerolineales bacterium]
MHIDYLLLRLGRHLIPAPLVAYLLRNAIILRPGPETRKPLFAKNQYEEALAQVGETFAGKRVMVFGYGGHFALGCALLQAGAGHVVLCDKYAAPDDRANANLLATYGEYLALDGKRVRPREEYITLLQADIRQVAARMEIPQVDLVLSRSVYEHLDDVPGITRSLAILTKPSGTHIHYINLSDHIFRYPFEMLTFSERTWKKWLNPTSNLNRYRYLDYKRIFEEHFEKVQAAIWDRDREAFQKARPRIRPEFISGDPEIDAATKVLVIASSPKPTLATK